MLRFRECNDSSVAAGDVLVSLLLDSVKAIAETRHPFPIKGVDISWLPSINFMCLCSRRDCNSGFLVQDMEVDPPTMSSSIFAVKRKKGTVDTTLPWVEKYRPKKVDEVVYQDEVVSVLKKCLKGEDFPHLLFYGPPGTGKTSTILALAHEMFGSQFRDRVLELNSSDERGIDVIRKKVKAFSSSKVSGKLADGTKCPAIKIVILDEADSMTTAAQSALRRIIEAGTETTRFCIICNYVTRIITPIASRCTKFRFKSLTNDLILKKLQDVSSSENLTVDSNAVFDEVIKVSDGDLRKAITFLQTIFRIKAKQKVLDDKSVVKSAHVTLDDVHEVSGFIPSNIFGIIIKSVMSKDFNAVERSVSSIAFNGFSSSQFLLQLSEWILNSTDLTWRQKCPVIKKIAHADACLLDGSSEYLQLLNVLTCLLQVIRDPSAESVKEDYRQSS